MPEQRKHRVYKIEKNRICTMQEDELAKAVEARIMRGAYALHETDEDVMYNAPTPTKRRCDAHGLPAR